MNPELQRNFWLEFTMHRLLAMPAILGLLFVAIALFDKTGAAEALAWTGLIGFGLITLVWGTRLAANSMLDEMVDKTWDWQRLSTLGPWTMTWGKLFGSTAFAWYGGLICLFVFLATAGPGFHAASPVKTVLIAVLTGVLLHAVAIASAVHMMQRSPSMGTQSRRSFGILLILMLLWGLPGLMISRFDGSIPVEWYRATFELHNFMLASMAGFAAWAVIGAYRTMSQNLAVRTTPWVWMLFLLFLTFYFAGFMMPLDEFFRPSLVVVVPGLLLSMFFTYVLLFTEASGPVVIRRLLQRIRRKEWRHALEEMPLWPLCWAYATVCAVVLALLGLDAEAPFVPEISFVPVPAVLLIARDAFMLLFFSAAQKPKRVVGTTVVYMFILYWLIPMLLFAMDMNTAAKIVLPVLDWQNSSGQIVSAAIQVTVAGVLAIRRIRQNFAAYRTADGD